MNDELCPRVKCAQQRTRHAWRLFGGKFSLATGQADRDGSLPCLQSPVFSTARKVPCTGLDHFSPGTTKNSTFAQPRFSARVHLRSVWFGQAWMWPIIYRFMSSPSSSN